MTGYEYEAKCAKLLEAKGFKDIKVTPGSGDQGIDILAKKGAKKYGIQCKYYEGSVGNKAVQEAYAGASFYDCAVAMVITNSKLTAPAKKLAQKLAVEVWEGIDAIYLRNNDAAYQKKEKERIAREQKALKEREKAKKAEELQTFQLWQKEYKTVIGQREDDIRGERELLESAFSAKMAELTSEWEWKNNELSERKSLSSAEESRIIATLSNASIFQFAKKQQAKNRLSEVREEITKYTHMILEEREKYEAALQALMNKHRQELVALTKACEERMQLPKSPEIVEQIKRHLMQQNKLDWATGGNLEIASVRRDDAQIKRFILLALWLCEKTSSYGDITAAVPALKAFRTDFIEKLLSQLEKAGDIAIISSLYYSLAEDSSISDFEAETYSSLADYSKTEYETIVRDSLKVDPKAYNPWYMFNTSLVSKKNIQQLVFSYLSDKKEAPFRGICNIPELQPIAIDRIDSILNELCVQKVLSRTFKKDKYSTYDNYYSLIPGAKIQ